MLYKLTSLTFALMCSMNNAMVKQNTRQLIRNKLDEQTKAVPLIKVPLNDNQGPLIQQEKVVPELFKMLQDPETMKEIQKSISNLLMHAAPKSHGTSSIGVPLIHVPQINEDALIESYKMVEKEFKKLDPEMIKKMHEDLANVLVNAAEELESNDDSNEVEELD